MDDVLMSFYGLGQRQQHQRNFFVRNYHKFVVGRFDVVAA